MKKLSGRLMFASPSVSADILYAGGFHAPDAVIYFEIPEKKALVLSHLEYARGKREAGKGVDVLNREDFLRDNDKRTDLNVMLKLSDVFGVKRWNVPADFPLGIADALRAAGIEVIPIPDPYFPRREIKTAAELKKIAEAENATEDSMRYARDLIRESKVNSKGFLILSGKLLTSERLRSEIEGFLKTHGYTASQTITACGPDASRPHELGAGPLRAGEPIVCDIFPRSDMTGYWGDMTRTFCKGKALPIVRKAYNAVLKASELAQKLIRDGVIAADVHNAAKESMESDGFITGRNRNGCAISSGVILLLSFILR